MAVVLESYGVVARRAVVEEKLAGGLAGWFEASPSRMVCADAHLCLVAFMAQEDASAFLMKLESLGLQSERDGEYRDAALVTVNGPATHRCPWLEVGRYAGVPAAWMVGVEPDPIIVPMAWRPNSIVNLSEEEAAKRLKFVRRDGGVEVFVDTETGQEVFRGRTSPPDQLDPEIEAKFRRTVEDIKPLLTWDGRPKKLGWFERRRLTKGIRELEALATGDRWRVWWFLGMARRAAADVTGAFDALQRAYEINPAHPDVSRELGGQCLALGRGEQAVAVCERNCMLHPEDAGLRSNLALSCVIAGDMTRAKLEVTRAVEMDPGDKITRVLETMIDDIASGKRPRPTRYP